MVVLTLRSHARRGFIEDIISASGSITEPSPSRTPLQVQPAATVVAVTFTETAALRLDSYSPSPSPLSTPLGSDAAQINDTLPVAAVVIPILLGLVVLIAVALWYRRRRLLQLSVRQLESSILEPFGDVNGSTNSRTALVDGPASPAHTRSIWVSNIAAGGSGRGKEIDEEETEERTESFRATSSAPMRSISLSTRATLVAPSVVLSERTLVDPVRPRDSSTTTPQPGKSPKRRRARGSRPPPVAGRHERSGDDDPLSRLEREQWLERYRQLEEERDLLSPLEAPAREDGRGLTGLGSLPSPVITTSPVSQLARGNSSTT